MIRIDRNGVLVPIPPDIIEASYTAQDDALRQHKTLAESETAAGQVIDSYVANLPSIWFPTVQPSLKARDGTAYQKAIDALDPRDLAAKQVHVDRDYEVKVTAHQKVVEERAAARLKEVEQAATTTAPNEPAAESAAPARAGRGAVAKSSEPEG